MVDNYSDLLKAQEAYKVQAEKNKVLGLNEKIFQEQAKAAGSLNGPPKYIDPKTYDLYYPYLNK